MGTDQRGPVKVGRSSDHDGGADLGDGRVGGHQVGERPDRHLAARRSTRLGELRVSVRGDQDDAAVGEPGEAVQQPGHARADADPVRGQRDRPAASAGAREYSSGSFAAVGVGHVVPPGQVGQRAPGRRPAYRVAQAAATALAVRSRLRRAPSAGRRSAGAGSRLGARQGGVDSPAGVARNWTYLVSIGDRSAPAKSASARSPRSPRAPAGRRSRRACTCGCHRAAPPASRRGARPESARAAPAHRVVVPAEGK